jgi:ESCRT-I complex subunit VPS28
LTTDENKNPKMSNTKISLWATPQQRRMAEDQAELFAILRATEKLEFAYARDAIDSDEYTEACQRLITQFKATEKALRQDGTITDTQTFVTKYGLDCPRAVERLLTSGVPATVLHGGSGATRSTNEVVLSAEVTSAFITCMDTARMVRVLSLFSIFDHISSSHTHTHN